MGNARTQMEEPEPRFLTSLILISGYLLVGILANLTVTKQISFGHGLSIPIGSLLWAITFTWIDLVNDHLGHRRARQLVFVTIAANVVMILWFQLYIHLPGASGWTGTQQSAINLVLGGYLRIYLASVVTSLICENLDISVFHYVKVHRPDFPRWSRSLASNTFSAPLDAILFYSIAFIGVMPTTVLLTTILTGALYKLAVAYISTPFIYLVKARRSERPQPASAIENEAAIVIGDV